MAQRFARRPLSTAGVVTAAEWDAAIESWATAPELAAIPEEDHAEGPAPSPRRRKVQMKPPPKELVIDDALAAIIEKRELARTARRKAKLTKALDKTQLAALSAEARNELGEDALAQAVAAFEEADANASGDLDRDEVQVVLRTMGINAAEELTSVFMGSAGDDAAARMDLDEFLVMLAPETARKARAARGAPAAKPGSPEKRKFPRGKARERGSALDYDLLVSDAPRPEFQNTFTSTRTSLPEPPTAAALSPSSKGGGYMFPAVETPRASLRAADGSLAEKAAPAPAKQRETFLSTQGLRESTAPPEAIPTTPGESSAPSFAGYRMAGLAPEVAAVDEACAAEVDGLHSLSESLAALTGSLDDLKTSMTDFWSERHATIDAEERATAAAAVTIQKTYRRHLVKARMRQWVAEEDDDDLAAQLENVRVAVAQFCLANHVDFDRVEKKFADVNASLAAATRDHVEADRLLGWNPDEQLDELAGSRATAVRIRSWQQQHARL